MSSSRQLALPLSAWLVTAGALAFVTIEMVLGPTRSLGPVYTVARVSAYMSATVSVTAAAAAVFAFALLTWSALRYFGTGATFGQVADALVPCLWILVAHAAVGLLLFALLPVPSLDLAAGPDAYLRGVSARGPVRWIEATRPSALALAVLASPLLLRRRIGCEWLDAAVAVGLAAAIIGSAAVWLNVIAGWILP